MKCLCDSGDTFELMIEGDVGADPFWCKKCYCNLDINDLSLSESLKDELIDWAEGYGEWIDWDFDRIRPGGIQLEEKHNRIGIELTEKARRELHPNYQVEFSPSSMAKMYCKRKF
ncbi:hypothetical protein FZC78_02015 [Rossellomorea vietnamensis]|uniref:Uncharacterized protein n=1 Tax=Rossellomorea vietnamensis TaxID=218284 RepID=A0A5D4P1Y7_9BACI|nr:hypothetical protein [Rossellomorea vietnamensis]TYS19828.1 hypothetical protein FZC78_02015 [Rossellomorea vietnamensis]